MKYPKGAIRTEEGLRAGAKLKETFWFVEWDNSPGPVMVKIIKFALPYDGTFKAGNKYKVEFTYKSGENSPGHEDYWLFKGHAYVPSHDPEEARQNGLPTWADRCFFFPKEGFWHAYAYWLKSRAKES